MTQALSLSGDAQAVILNRKARQSYRFSVTTKHSKMICFVDGFRQVLGDRFQDAFRLREKHLFSDHVELTTHSNCDRL